MPIGSDPELKALLALVRIAITVFCVIRAGKLMRNRFGWGIFAFFLPLPAIIAIAIVKPKEQQQNTGAKSIAEGSNIIDSSQRHKEAPKKESFFERTQKKMLRHGPGSPGETAKMIANAYNMMKPDNHLEEWNDTFKAISGMRMQGWIASNMIPKWITPENLEKLVNASGGDLATLTFYLMYVETDQFRRNITTTEDTFNLATEVMYETIMGIAPSSLTKSLSNFRQGAIKFARYYSKAIESQV